MTSNEQRGFDAGTPSALSQSIGGDTLIVSDLRAYLSMRATAHESECDDPTWPVPHDIALVRRALQALSSQPAPAGQMVWHGSEELATKYMIAAGLSEQKARAIALMLSKAIGFAQPPSLSTATPEKQP